MKTLITAVATALVAGIAVWFHMVKLHHGDRMYERRADIAGAWLYDDDGFRELVRQETGGIPPVR